NELTDDEVLNSYISSSQNFETDEVDRLIILDHLEKKFFKNVSNKVEGYYTSVGMEVNIWTVKVSPKNEEDITQPPILFIHGLCAGIAHWTKAMDKASSNQVCYFIDLPGFAKSSRPDFSTSLDVAENAMIQFIENWRVNNKIEGQLRLVGHSFGGYISFLYAAKFPKNISSLILLDPWGIYSSNLDTSQNKDGTKGLSLKLKMTKAGARYISPMAIVRKTGMIGKFLLKSLRYELYLPYKDYVTQDTFFDYIVYTNMGQPT
ncbi:MAG: 1-acylglycerol-3-phosphate O-acyltransferase abhd5, partial [Paramarteilia canceri]